MLNKKSVLGLVVACLFAAPFAFGAEAVIVYNPANGSFGSYHGPNLSRAQTEQDALEECGANCNGLTDPMLLEQGVAASGIAETYTDVYGGWVSVARSASNPEAYGTSGLHDSQYDAEQSALSNCANKGASDCSTVRDEEAY